MDEVPELQQTQAAVLGDADPPLLSAFMAAIKAVGFYPPGNPVRDRMLDSLVAGLARAASGPEGLTIQFRSDRVLQCDTPIIARGDDGWEIMARLFESGLRDLNFLPGADRRELEPLLHLLARTVRGELNPTDEDLSVLLWEIDLPAVTYRVMDTPEEQMPLAVDAPLSAANAAEQDGQGMWEGIHPLERYQASAGGLEDADIDPRGLRADEGDLGHLRNMAKQENRLQRAKLVMVLTEVLLLDLSAPEFERIMDLLRGHALDMLQQGGFRIYRRVLDRLAEHSSSMSPQNETAARALLDDLHGVEAARRALGANESERCDDPQWAVELLGGLDAAGLALIRKAAASAMGGGGDEIRDSLLGRSLTRAARLRPAVLLDDPRSLGESDLRLLALILPQPLTPEQADQWSERLLPIAASEDSGVRVGLLRLLAAIRPPNLERILFLALEDREGQVRMMAAELIGECIGAKALQPLLQVLLSSGFEQREYEEQAAFYIALAQASPPEVLPLLEKTIGRRSWLAPRHWRVQKACALRALSWIPIEKAGPILMKYRNSQDPLLAEASREALERHRCSLNGEHGAVRRGA